MFGVPQREGVIRWKFFNKKTKSPRNLYLANPYSSSNTSLVLYQLLLFSRLNMLHKAVRVWHTRHINIQGHAGTRTTFFSVSYRQTSSANALYYYNSSTPSVVYYYWPIKQHSSSTEDIPQPTGRFANNTRKRLLYVQWTDIYQSEKQKQKQNLLLTGQSTSERSFPYMQQITVYQVVGISTCERTR